MVESVNSGSAATSPTGTVSPPGIDAAARTAIAANRSAAGVDVAGVARDLAAARAANPARADAIAAAVERQLTPVQRGELARALDAASAPAAAQTVLAQAPAPVDPVKLGLDLTQMALDIVGIVEPTPFADGSNAVISAGRAIGSLFSGEFGEAGGHALNGVISAAGIVAGLGDLAKAGKIGKWAQTVSDAVQAIAANPALRASLEPALRTIHDAVGKIPQAALDALPASARNSLERMKAQLDEFFGAGARNAPMAERLATARQNGTLAELVGAAKATPGGVDELVRSGLRFDEVGALERGGSLTAAEARTFDAAITTREVSRLRGAGANIDRGIDFDARQLQAKFKHASDFGVSGNYNPANRAAFGDAVRAHVDNPATIPVSGTYRGNPVTHFLDPSTGRNVVRDADGNFLSAWRLSDGQLKNVLSNGNLGGG